MGGYVALAFARRHFDRLKALVLADTKAAAAYARGSTGGEAAIALVDCKAWLPCSKDRYHVSCRLQPATACAPKCARWEPSRPIAVSPRSAPCATDPDRTDELSAIAVPTLVMVGTQDVLPRLRRPDHGPQPYPHGGCAGVLEPLTLSTWRTADVPCRHWQDSSSRVAVGRWGPEGLGTLS